MACSNLAAVLCEDAEAQADVAECALDVCLQQPAFRQADARVAISLLRVSKRLAAMVAARCGGGTLGVHAIVKTPAQADALAAWLSSHGGLLAELTLDVVYDMSQMQRRLREQQQHPAARVFEQLPGNLRRLVFDNSYPGAEPGQAAALAAALSRQPMQQLRHLALPRSLCDQAATVLPALAALGQLTSLVMWIPHRPRQLPAQHLQHLPAQLQQLELHSNSGSSSAALLWLALPHVTGLTSLTAAGMRVVGGALPRGLRALTVANVSTAVPLRQLSQLKALQLMHCKASAEQLRQLSALQRLEQLSVALTPGDDAGTLSNAAPVLCALPLVHLSACSQELTAACLDHLGACTRLTDLQLSSCSLAPGVTPEQLAAMLGRLTALERCDNTCMDLQLAAGDAAWAPVCQVLARLPRLTACGLSGVKLGPAAVAHLAAATQLTELCVVHCGLDDASVLALCSGLTGLRSLDVCCNNLLGDGCLEGIAALRQLTWLQLVCTNVTEAGQQRLQAARPEWQLARW